MAYTLQQRQEIAQIINSGLVKADLPFTIKQVTADDIHYQDFASGLIGFTPGGYNPMNQVFNGLSKNRYKDFGQFHHFKNRNIALSIIQNKSIQLSSYYLTTRMILLNTQNIIND